MGQEAGMGGSPEGSLAGAARQVHHTSAPRRARHSLLMRLS